MGLAALVLLACLITAFGISFARYRADYSQSVNFLAQKPGQICLGTMATTDEPNRLVFDHQSVGSWEQVNDSLQLDLTVANGTSDQDYTRQDQSFTFQLVGGLGIWDGTQVVDITLRVYRPEPMQDQYDEYPATATQIQKGSPLYQTYGDGWVFSFPDEAGQERTWALEGTAFSTVDMTVILEGNELTQPSLLQPVVTGYQ